MGKIDNETRKCTRQVGTALSQTRKSRNSSPSSLTLHINYSVQPLVGIPASAKASEQAER